jgi:hypothetical protein
MLAGVGTTRDMIFAEELNTRLVLPTFNGSTPVSFS